jgi:hypothetical protein
MKSDYVNTSKIQRTLLKQKRRLRFETFLIVTGAGMLGWLASLAMFHIGLKILWARYVISATIGYAIFLVLYWLWIKHIVKDFAENIGRYEKERAPRQGEGLDVDWVPSLPDGADLELFGIILGVVAIVLALIFIVVIAPTMLLDLCTTEIAIFAITRRISSQVEKELFVNILKKTYWIFVVLIVILLVWSLILEICFPGQDSISAILKDFLRKR